MFSLDLCFLGRLLGRLFAKIDWSQDGYKEGMNLIDLTYQMFRRKKKIIIIDIQGIHNEHILIWNRK